MPNEKDDRPPEQAVIPVVEEEVVAGAKPVTTGGVRIEKHVETSTRRIDMPLIHEEVEVRRVPVNRVVSQPPSVRKEGNLTIIPVLEEQLVVEKRLVLKEEIHISKKRFKERTVKDVDIERERAVVHRLDEHGRVVDRAAAAKTRRARSILD